MQIELSEIDLMDVDEVISSQQRISSENVRRIVEESSQQQQENVSSSPSEQDNGDEKSLVERDKEGQEEEGEEAILPIDPRAWTADDIKCWLKWVVRKFNVNPAPDYGRFPTSGVELVQLTRAEFWVCAGQKCGDLLTKHLAILMQPINGKMAPTEESYEQEPCTCIFLQRKRYLISYY